jgi:aarF domain-containing kinase
MSKQADQSIFWIFALFIRGLYLMACFSPFMIFGLPLVLISLWISSLQVERQEVVSAFRRFAWRLLLFGCRSTGCATIKWAQWAATRGDLFDPDFCRIMSSLHEAAPTHTFAHTVRTVEAALQRPLNEAFMTFDPVPLASASIAQVHRATWRVSDGSQQDRTEEVIVKVRHPNVAEHIKMDFEIFKLLASFIAGLKVFKGLPIKESIAMFSSTMTAQTDFRVEAAHLERFYLNFSNSSITTPKPLWASEAVLIETFEQGQSVAKFMGKPGRFNAEIVSLGVDCYLSMLLRDRFVHQDLHPGNIMARTPTCEGEHTELILLDFGLAEELTVQVQHQFVAFLSSICSGDGNAATDVLLSWTSLEQECPDPEALRRDMIALFEVECDRGPSSQGVDLDKVMKSILKLARKHEVTIDSSYAALVISVCVIVGFATSLDPQVNVIDAATSCILAWRLTGKIMGKLYG